MPRRAVSSPTSSPSRDDEGLDEVELERLYARLEGPLYNAVYRWVWDEEEARDIVQDAFMRLWRMRARVRMSSVESLLWRIALNRASNRRRARKLRQWLSIDAVSPPTSPTPQADALLATHQDHQALRDAVDALPEKLRRVILMCEFSGMSYQEISDVLDIPPGTVASRRHNAIKRLRKTLSRARTS